MSNQSKFYYRRGSIETVIPWKVPTIERFDAWFSEWIEKTKESNEEYSIFLGGSFAKPYWKVKNEGVEKYPIETWDVDIILIGPKNLQKLKILLDEASQIGFNHELLIDISWDDMLYDDPNYEKTLNQRLKIRNNWDVLKISEFENFYWTADNLVPFGVSYSEIHPGLWEYRNIGDFNLNKHKEKKNYTIQLK